MKGWEEVESEPAVGIKQEATPVSKVSRTGIRSWRREKKKEEVWL